MTRRISRAALLAVIAGGLAACDNETAGVYDEEPVTDDYVVKDADMAEDINERRAGGYEQSPEEIRDEIAEGDYEDVPPAARPDAGRDMAARAPGTPSPRGDARPGARDTAMAGGMNAQVFGENGTRLIVEPQAAEQVRVGEPFRYTFVVRNEGDMPVHGVNLQPVGFTNVSLSGAQNRAGDQQADRQSGRRDRQAGDQQRTDRRRDQQARNAAQGAQGDGWQGERRAGGSSGEMPQAVQVGTLAPGESKQVAMRLVPQSEGQIAACIAVDYEEVVCATAEAVKPELVVRREVPQQQYICDELTMTYIVRNTGSGQTEPATLTEQLPEGLTTAEGTREIRLDLGPIEAGGEVRREVTLQASRGGEFTSSALVKTGSTQARSQDARFRILDPELEIDVSGPETEYLDRPITYTVTVTNVSDDPAPDTMVMMPLPDGVERPSFSGDVQVGEGGQFMIGMLEPGASREFSVSFAGVEPGRLQATARANARCAEAVTDQITTNVKGIAALRVETIDLVDPVPVGETTEYVIQLKNQGTAKSINVRATADMPDGMTFVDARGDSRVSNDGGTLTFEPIRELAPNDVVEWRVRARADEAGKRRFRLMVQSDATRKQIVEVEPTTLY